MEQVNESANLGRSELDRLIELDILESSGAITQDSELDLERFNLLGRLETFAETNPEAAKEVGRELMLHENPMVRLSAFWVVNTIMEKGAADIDVLKWHGELISSNNEMLLEIVSDQLENMDELYEIIKNYGTDGLLLALGLPTMETEQTIKPSLAANGILFLMEKVSDWADIEEDRTALVAWNKSDIEARVNEFVSGALVENQPEIAAELLLKLARHKEPYFRSTAAIATGYLSNFDKSSTAQIVELLANDPDEHVRDSLAEGMDGVELAP